MTPFDVNHNAATRRKIQRWALMAVGLIIIVLMAWCAGRLLQ